MMTIRRLTTFGLIGTLGTGAHYLTLVILVELMHVDPVTAATAGFFNGALLNYFLNYRYTFRSTKAHRDAAPKFFLIAALTGLLNSLLVYFGVNILGINYLLAQIIATIVVFFSNFGLNALWTFREAHYP